MFLLSSSRSLHDRGATNNRPGFGRVLNHDGSSFPHGSATATVSGKYLLCDSAADSRRFLVSVWFPEIDRALFAAKSHFFYFGHVTFHSWVVANTSMLPFVVTVPPTLEGLLTKCWA